MVNYYVSKSKRSNAMVEKMEVSSTEKKTSLLYMAQGLYSRL